MLAQFIKNPSPGNGYTKQETRAGEPGVFGSLEPETLEKKPGGGAGAAWKKSQEPEPLRN